MTMLASLETFTAVWLPVLLDATIKGAALLALAGLVVLCMRRTSAAPRHAVWLLAMAGLLLLPLLSTALPGWPVLPKWCDLRVTTEVGSVVGADAGIVTLAPHSPTDDTHPAKTPAVEMWSEAEGSAGETPFDSDDHFPREPMAATTAEPIDIGEAPPAAEGSPASPSSPAAEPAAAEFATPGGGSLRSLLPWLSGMWSIGFLAAMGPILLGRLSLWWLERKARPIVQGPWVELLKRTTGELGIKREVLLLETDRCYVPMTAGILRPRLIVPSQFSTWTPDRRQVVMLHELGHVKRWDCLTKLVVQLASAVYWFNPAVWLARKCTRIEAEQACDDLVLEAGSTPCDYAEHLLAIAAGRQSGRLAACCAISMARRSKLEGRLLAIMDPRRSRRQLTRVGALLLTVTIAATAAVISCVRAAGPNAGVSQQNKAIETASAPTTRPAAGRIDSGWSKPVRGLKARVLCEKATFDEGEPIEITLELKCSVEKDYTFPEKPLKRCQLFPHLDVRVGTQDNPARLIGYNPVRLMVYNRVWIGKGEVFRRTLRLSELVALDKPGKYVIRAGHSNQMVTDTGDWLGEALSPPVTITVVQTDKPPQKDAAAIAQRRMVRQTMLNGRVHFPAGQPTLEEVIETVSRQSGVRIQPNWVELGKLNRTPKRKAFFQFDRSTTPLNALAEVLGRRVGFAVDRVVYLSSMEEINRLAGKVPAGPVTPGDIAWGKAVDGIRVGLSPRMISLDPGEKTLTVRVSYENVSPKPQEVPVHKAANMYKLMFGGSFGGKPFYSDCLVERAKVSPPRPHLLKPGQRFSETFTLGFTNLGVRPDVLFYLPGLEAGKSLTLRAAWTPFGNAATAAHWNDPRTRTSGAIIVGREMTARPVQKETEKGEFTEIAADWQNGLKGLRFVYPSRPLQGVKLGEPAVYAIPRLQVGAKYDYLAVFRGAPRGKYGKAQANSRFTLIGRLPGGVYPSDYSYRVEEVKAKGRKFHCDLAFTQVILPGAGPNAPTVPLFHAELAPLPPGEYSIVFRTTTTLRKVGDAAPTTLKQPIDELAKTPFRTSFTIAPATRLPTAAKDVNAQQAGKLRGPARASYAGSIMDVIGTSKMVFVGKVVDLTWQKATMQRIKMGDIVATTPETRAGTAVFECTQAIRGVKVGQRVSLGVLKDIVHRSSYYTTRQTAIDAMFERIQIELGSQWLLCVDETPMIHSIAYVPTGREPIIGQVRQLLQLHAMPPEKQLPEMVNILRQKRLSEGNPLVQYALDHVGDDSYQGRRLETADLLNAGFLDKTNTPRIRYLMLHELSHLVPDSDKTELGEQASLKIKRLLLEDAVAIQSAEKRLLGDYVPALAGKFGLFKAPDASPAFPKGLSLTRLGRAAQALRYIAARFEQYAAERRERMKGLPAGSSSRPHLAGQVRDHVQKKNHCLKLAVELEKRTAAAVSDLIGALSDEAGTVRWKAAEALGNMGPSAKSAIPALIKALSDEVDTVRWKAAEALGKMGPSAKSAIPALIKASNNIASRAAEALGRIGPAAIPALIEALKEEGKWRRCAAADALGRIGPKAHSAVPALGWAMRDKDPRVAEKATATLARIGPAAVATLLEAARDEKNAALRLWALHSLGQVKPPGREAVAALIDAVKDRQWEVAATAARALGDMGSAAKDAVPTLNRALIAGDRPALWQAAARSLWKITPSGREVIIAALHHRALHVRRIAVRVILNGWRREQARAGGGPVERLARNVVRALSGALSDSDPEVRYQAAEGLGHMGKEAVPVIPQLIALLGDQAKFYRIKTASRGRDGRPSPPPGSEVYFAVMGTLTGIGAPAIAPLAKAAEKASPTVRRRIYLTLIRIAQHAPPLRHSVTAQLQRLTGEDIGPDMVKWTRWLVKQPKTSKITLPSVDGKVTTPNVEREASNSDKTPKAPESEGRSNGIAFSIVAKAKTVYLGEPLMLSFVAKNVSKHNVVLPVSWGFQCFSVDVTHGGDTYREGNPFCFPGTPVGLSAVTLAPNESYTLGVDLLRLLRIVSRKGQKVGTYTVRAELTSSGRYPHKFQTPIDYRDCWKGSVKVKLDVKVLPSKNADDAAALKVLRSGGPGAPEISDNLWSAWYAEAGRGDKRFSTILQKHPNSPLAPWCHLALARSYAYAAKLEQYRRQRDRLRSKVIEHCKAILKNYPKSRVVKTAKDLLAKAS